MCKRPSVYLYQFEPEFIGNVYSQTLLSKYFTELVYIRECANYANIKEAEKAKIYKKIRKRINKYEVSPTEISSRQFCLAPASLGTTPENRFEFTEIPRMLFGINEGCNGLLLDKRMSIYADVVKKVLENWYEKECIPPSEIIHASCAGYLSPSPAQQLVSVRKWFDTSVTHCYHMGCYSSIPALKIAAGFATPSLSNKGDPENKIDILHTELLSLHLDVSNVDPSNIINMTLFGDGFVKYSLSTQKKNDVNGLKLLTISERIIPESLADMTWIPGPFQFKMGLSKNVPAKVRASITEFVIKMCSRIELDFAHEKKQLQFAIHPGGPKVLDCVRDQLGLDESKIEASRRVLYNYGNMSSATLPIIWTEIVKDSNITPGTKIISVAFGPGITICGAIMEKV